MTTGVVLGFVVFLVAVGEVSLLTFWVPWYLRRGIRVAREAVQMSSSGALIVALETKGAAGLLSSRLALRRLSEREVAFQEAGLPIALWSPIPVIRGIILADPANGRAEVRAVLLWYPLVTIACLLVGLWSEGVGSALLVTGAAAGVVLVMGAVQRSRYRTVARGLSEQPDGET